VFSSHLIGEWRLEACTQDWFDGPLVAGEIASRRVAASSSLNASSLDTSPAARHNHTPSRHACDSLPTHAPHTPGRPARRRRTQATDGADPWKPRRDDDDDDAFASASGGLAGWTVGGVDLTTNGVRLATNGSDTISQTTTCDHQWQSFCDCRHVTSDVQHYAVGYILWSLNWLISHSTILCAALQQLYRVVQKNGATLHFPKYLENYWR